MEELSRFCCPNPDCEKYLERGAGTIRVRARYGPHRRRLLYCLACQTRFSETRGTPLFNSHLDPQKALDVLAHVHEGCGVRQTARLVGVDRETVSRLGRMAGEHSYDAHDELVGFSPLYDQVATGREVGLRLQEREEL
jgi:transposase-like protein